MGERGPVPKRSELRRRTNAPEDGIELSKVTAGPEPEWMEPPGDLNDPDDRTAWHPIAENWYLGLQTSGQAIFYEQSDADTAYILAENLSRLLKPQFVGLQERWNRDADAMEKRPAFVTRHITGGDLSAILKGMGMLGVTEGDRRRMRIELQRGSGSEQGQTPGQAAVAGARARLGLIQGGMSAEGG